MVTQFDKNRTLRSIGIVAGCAWGIGLLALFIVPTHFLRAYLVAYQFWLGISLGSLGLLLLHYLTGGRWGRALRLPLHAALPPLPVMALLFLPLALGVATLYEWADPAVVAEDPLLQEKRLYLNTPFFLVRAAIYFVLWLSLAVYLMGGIKQLRKTGVGEQYPDQRETRPLSGPGLVVYGIAGTFAAIDWLMSLEPHWYSSLYGVLIVISYVVPAFALAMLVFTCTSTLDKEFEDRNQANKDIANLLFAFVLLWVYMNFSQFFLIWSGNLPEEITWYLRRTRGGWGLLAGVLVCLCVIIPFVVLLSDRTKRSSTRLTYFGGFLLLSHYLYQYWLIAPAWYSHLHKDTETVIPYIHAGWTQVVAFLAVGSCWSLGYLWWFPREFRSPAAESKVQEVSS